MSALGRKVMDLAEQQGLLDGKAIAELRRQVAESKFVVTPEAIAKILVDHGHLTPFQARKLVSQAQGNEPDPIEQRVVAKDAPRKPNKPIEDLTLADSAEDLTSPSPPTSAGRNEEDIVDLEPIEPGPRPTPQRAGKVPASESGKKPTARPVQPPREDATIDDLVELEPIDAPSPTDALGQSRSRRWKTDAPAGETIEMDPFDVPPPGPAPSAGAPVMDDLFGPDPFAAPQTRPTTSPASAPTPKPQSASSDLFPDSAPAPLKPSKPPESRQRPQPRQPIAPAATSVWDSPLILIGGGALGIILVIFCLLLYALTRGSAAEMFAKAEEEYRGGSYGGAIAIYEKFLEKYPSDPNASLARVRLGMGMLRQVTDSSKNPNIGLDTAKKVLPIIEKEEKFGEARPELATILPEIADSFATEAGHAQKTSDKERFVKLCGEALALVNNPSYLPASLRKEREGRISRIVDKLKYAERSIQQDQDLATAVTKITAAADKGDAASAYELQAALLRTYPGLETKPELVASIRQVGEKERQLVAVTEGGPAPLTKDQPRGSERIVLSQREGTADQSGVVSPACVLVEGAMYGLDAVSGKVLWRRFIGYETTSNPILIKTSGKTDAVFVDGRSCELVRVNAQTGELRWRQPLGEQAFEPVLANNRLFVTTRKGQVTAIEADSGQIVAVAQLPQGAGVAPAVRQSRIYQLGEHSTLFVLDATSLACTETVYLGHKAGAILVPPVAVLDAVLFVESPADDFTWLHVLAPDAKTKKLTRIGRPQRLAGRITTSLAVSGARVAAITDLAEVDVFDVEPESPDHIRRIARLDASETTPRLCFCALDRNRLWVTARRRSFYDVQDALGKLNQKWTENQDDSFVSPIQMVGEMQLQVRRRVNEPAAFVQAFNSNRSESLWNTRLAVPILALAVEPSSGALTSLTADGRLYFLSPESFQAGLAEKPSFTSGKGVATIFPRIFESADGQQLVWTQRGKGGNAFVYDVKAGGQPKSVALPGQASAPAAMGAGGIVAPLTQGAVAFVPLASSELQVAPLMPLVAPDDMPRWTMPTPLADGKTFVISDGRGSVYAVTKRDQPQAKLEGIETRPGAPVTEPFVAIGSTAIGILHQTDSDALVGIDARGRTVFDAISLKGRVEAGPFALGGLVVLAAEPDGLVCIGSDGKQRWQQPLVHGPLAGPVLATSSGDLIVIYQSGLVFRLDAKSGEEMSSRDIGEPCLGPAAIMGDHAVVAGSDGVVHRLPLPKGSSE